MLINMAFLFVKAMTSGGPNGASDVALSYMYSQKDAGPVSYTHLFDPVNSLVSGSMTEQQWIDGIKSASDQMRANIIE